MAIGSLFVARCDTAALVSQQEYYFAGSRPGDRILLVHFFKRSDWCVQYITLSRSEFLCLEQSSAIYLREPQRLLPVWLEPVEGVNFEEVENLRYKSKKRTYSDAVADRLIQISGGASELSAILLEPNLERAIGTFQKKDALGCNRNRFKLWFWSYVLHGFNRWSLQQKTHGCGGWDRGAEQHRHKKFGRPSLTPTSFTSSSVLFDKQCVASFKKQSRKHKTWLTIYIAALRHDFKVVAVRQPDGSVRLINKENEPFPSSQQFRYCVLKELGVEHCNVRLYGRKHARQIARHDEGSFKVATRNILEKMEADAYHSAILPVAIGGEGAAAPLIVCRGICTTVSGFPGIGFSEGAERGEAYCSMLFSCVAPRDLLERIYGFSSGTLVDWVICGISAEFRTDRGPGATVGANDSEYFNHPISSLTPAGEGQSKADIESSNPRSSHIEGRTHPQLSKLTIHELMKYEILQTLKINDSRALATNLPPEVAQHFRKEGLAATPNNYYRYLDERHCTSAIQVDLSTAIRAWCKKVTFRLERGCVQLEARPYSSAKLVESHFFRTTIREGQELTGYIVPLTIRVAWVEIEGLLIEVKAQLPFRAQSEELDATFEQAQAHSDDVRKLNSASRDSIVAETLMTQQTFEEETGKAWPLEAMVTRKAKRQAA